MFCVQGSISLVELDMAAVERWSRPGPPNEGGILLNTAASACGICKCDCTQMCGVKWSGRWCVATLADLRWIVSLVYSDKCHCYPSSVAGG